MMEEEFYSTIKLSSGEELIAKICYLPDEDSILLENPMLVESITQKKGKQKMEGFVLKEWISSSYDQMFIIKMNQVITLSELEESIKEFYLNCLEEKSEQENKKNTYAENNRIDMGNYSGSRQSINELCDKGYIGSVEKHKKILEEIFKKS
jgi:hypothetical protein